MVEPWRAEFWFICRGHLLTSFQERPIPGHTQLKGLLQDGEGMAKAIRRKGNSEMSTEKAKENLKGLFNSCAMLCLPALPGTEGCGSRTSPPPVRTSRLRTGWTEMEEGDSLGKSKAGPSPTSEKTAAKRRKPSTKCPHICERSDQQPTHLLCCSEKESQR